MIYCRYNKCSKCGESSIKSEYDNGTALSELPKNWNMTSKNESIRRTCLNCGYVWHEDCLDAEEKK